MDAQGLVDLSLFAESPTYDRHYSTVIEQRSQHHDQQNHQPREFDYALPRYYSNKPLPPLPPRRICSLPKYSSSRACDMESRCILSRIRRSASSDQSHTQGDTLARRRNLTAPPQLTLSVPPSHNRDTASEMVWMPDEQMWLIAGEIQRDIRITQSPPASQTAYPSPPSYSSPRHFTHSEPPTSIPPVLDVTPPLTPIQCQLQTLIQRREERDDERLSPLFHEAMNSVPMVDPEELLPPPLVVVHSQHSRSQMNSEETTYSVSPQTPGCVNYPARSVSLQSRRSPGRSNTTGSHSSYYSAQSEDLTLQDHSARRWQGLAQRIARPSSATH